MKALLIALVGIGVAVVWLCLKYGQAKSAYSKDLGDGGLQKLFDKDSK